MLLVQLREFGGCHYLKCKFFRTMTSALSELTWSNVLVEAAVERVGTAAQPPKQRKSPHGTNKSQEDCLSTATISSLCFPRTRKRENKDRIYWEESGKKQELWKSEIPNFLMLTSSVSKCVWSSVRVGDPCFHPEQATFRLCLAHVAHDSVLHLHFFTSFSLDLEFKKENLILVNVLISMPGLLLF